MDGGDLRCVDCLKAEIKEETGKKLTALEKIRMMEFLPSANRCQPVLLADSIRHFKELVIVVVDRIDLTLVLEILAAHVVEAEYIDQIVLQPVVHRVRWPVVVYVIRGSVVFVSMSFRDLRIYSKNYRRRLTNQEKQFKVHDDSFSLRMFSPQDRGEIVIPNLQKHVINFPKDNCALPLCRESMETARASGSSCAIRTSLMRR